MPLVVLIGPDGCGKTTLAELLSLRASSLGIPVSPIRNTNFGILPQAKVLRKLWAKIRRTHFVDVHAHEDGEVNAGMRHPPNNPLKGSCLLAWYTLDFIAGWGEVLRARHSGRLLIFTRYYHDYYYQRNHSRTPRGLIRSFEYFVPPPVATFYLHLEAAQVVQRKPELTPDEAARQNLAIEETLGERRNFIKLDASLPPEELLERAWGHLQGG